MPLSSAIERMDRWISATIFGWMPSVGSSRIISFGLVINALAMDSC